MKNNRFIKMATAMLVFGTLLFWGLGFLGEYHFLLDLFSHFRVYYLLALVLGGLLAWRLKLKIVGFAALGACLLIGWSLAPLHLPSIAPTDEKGVYIGAINLLSSNRDHQAVLDYVEKEDFDIIVFQELGFGWRRQLEKLATEYPYQKVQAQKGNFGIGIYSKIPLSNVEIYEFGQFKVPSIAANFNYKKEAYFIVGTHPVPPIGAFSFKMRNAQMAFVNKLVHSQSAKAIVMGDMNCTTFSPNFKKLSEGTTLRDTRLGFGACTSWEATIPLIGITIDHALVSEGVRVKHRGVGPYIGSDHFPLELTVY